MTVWGQRSGKRSEPDHMPRPDNVYATGGRILEYGVITLPTLVLKLARFNAYTRYVQPERPFLSGGVITPCHRTWLGSLPLLCGGVVPIHVTCNRIGRSWGVG